MKTVFTVALALVSIGASSAASAASIMVTTTTDGIVSDGDCSLREAMLAATGNAAVGSDCPAGAPNVLDRIRFDDALFGSSSATFNLAPGAGPLLAGGGSMILEVPADKRITVRTTVGAAQRLLEIDMGNADDEFTARNIDWGNGRASDDGGAVWIGGGGVIEFDDCLFNNNGTTANGGVIGITGFVPTILSLTNTRFTNNFAEGDGGAINSRGNATAQIAITGGTFIGNSATSGHGGAIALNAVADGAATQATIVDSVFEDNEALSSGALHASSTSSTQAVVGVQIYNSRFTDNRSLATGADGRGGALRIEGSQTVVNAALMARRSSFVGNHDASTVPARGAGAIALGAASFLLQNNLFALNTAAESSAGVTLDFRDDETTLRQAYVLGNSFAGNTLAGPGDEGASAAQLLLIGSADTTGWLSRLEGNLFHSGHGTEEGIADCRIIDNEFDPLTTLPAGYNIGNRSECAFGIDSVMADPQVDLVPMTDPVHALSLYPARESPALDLWPAASCTNLNGFPIEMDLPGNVRPVDGDGDGMADCDAGAFELAEPDDTIFSSGFED